MDITFLGHASFRIEIEDQVLLIDPWLSGNPVLNATDHERAVAGATHILITHGHFDHAGDAFRLSQELNAPLVGMNDLMGYFADQGADVIGYNRGGTVKLGNVDVSLVNAVHSSSLKTDKGHIHFAAESGFMIKGEGHMIYFSGDTDVMADMEWFGDYYKPDIGIVCAGGHFTMDMDKVAYASNRYFNFKTLIPCHYKTFPRLEQTADALIAALPDVNVIEPEVMKTIKI
ncbi:metallo Beta lactamase superfamily protein [Rhodobacterales bacterium HTCC2150]|nr:metallo Beta lactamase superfamily protein [Rhodobacterales bacterium HTCC2150] [Rhodobacteraceae bacterium HTCC2150]